MSHRELRYAWALAVVVAGMSLAVAAQSAGPARAGDLPAAPEAGNAEPQPSASFQAAVVKPAESYTPLSSRQKFHIFIQQTYSAYTFANTAFDAGWAQMTDDWPGYGQGAEGYGKRYGALLANHEAGSFFENFLFPSVLRQDPRYFRMGSGRSIFARVGYASSRVLITRADSGHNTFNSSLLLGMLFVDGLTNAYYPRPERGMGDTMTRFGGGVLSSAETNLLREFWPDMARIFHRHEPDRLKKLEELEKKVPLSDKFSPPKTGTVLSPADKPAAATGQQPGSASPAKTSAPAVAPAAPGAISTDHKP